LRDEFRGTERDCESLRERERERERERGGEAERESEMEFLFFALFSRRLQRSFP
jgi:hypothetical protein